ncbi:MAG: Smr/MutS family protein [Syntrophobacterales bacterium]|jgi:DNA-nicking Smr family endonuclease
MKKRRKKKSSSAPPRASNVSFNTPFAGLDEILKPMEVEPQPESEVDEPGGAVAEENGSELQSGSNREAEDDMFREAMAGVEPLESTRIKPRQPGPLSQPIRRPLLEGELEAYAELVDLVSGEGCFDIQYTDEYIEGAIVGADSALLPKLRRGDFSIQAHLDLHGMTATEARQAVERFILNSVIKGLRCVLIIHGRGLNSQDQIPILKERMTSWLKRGRLKHLVLAFATAQPCDGGAGALYVLLRKFLPMVSR